jgi:hypothetical protein
MLTNPIPAKRSQGPEKISEAVCPSDAPTKKSGVTSPPLKPELSVQIVRIALESHVHHGIWFELKKDDIVRAA